MLKADKEYKDLLAINPHSVATIRSYAKFLMEVVNDRSKFTWPLCWVVHLKLMLVFRARQ